MNPEELQERLLDFGVRVGKICDALPDTRMGRHVAGQLIRCGTSAPPNYGEACVAESKADFTHKMSICFKELNESHVWIRFIIKAQLLPEKQMLPMKQEAKELVDIFGKSLVTARDKDPRQRRGS